MPSLLDTVILRQKIATGFVTKGASIEWLEEDDNWTIVVDAIRALQSIPTDTSGFEEFNPATTYELGDYVSYNGNIYKFINNVPTAGETPDSSPLYWAITSQGEFAHERNKDQYLDYGGIYQVSAQDLFALLSSPVPGDAILQGTNTLTEAWNIYANGNTATISSGNGASAQAYKILVDTTGLYISYEDTDDPTNNCAIVLAPKEIRIIGDLRMETEGFTYYRGNESTDGSIRIGMVGDELVAQRRESGSWITQNPIISA